MIITLVAVRLYLVPGISVDAYALSVLAKFLIVFSAAMVKSWTYMKSIR